MYRIFILSLLAIVFGTFALEPSQVILRAVEIRGNAMVLEWSPIENAKTYKIFYDEETLVNPKSPEPILESASTDKTRLEMPKMLEGAAYYLVVRGYNDAGEKVGETLPLHASTLSLPTFGLREAQVIDDQHIDLIFSQPIDPKKTEVEIVNIETKKARSIESMKSSETDLRVLHLSLQGKLAPSVPHDVILKKVINTSGESLSPELNKKTAIVFSDTAKSDTVAVNTPDVPVVPEAKPVVAPEETPLKAETTPASVPEEEPTPLPVSDPDAAINALEQDTAQIDTETVYPVTDTDTIPETDKKPVEIDKLPQTGSSTYLLLLFAIGIGVVFSRKKYIRL